MNKKTIFSLIAIIIIISSGCAPNQPESKIEAGYYIFTKSEWFTTDKNGVHPKIEFKSALLRVIDSDSMKFIGEKSIGDFFWEHSDFKYKIQRNKIILTHGDFKKKLNFEVTTDHYLKFETNKDDLINIYFQPLTVKLSGKYRVFGFMKKESSDDEEILKVAKNVFSNESLNFISDNNVIIQPELAQIITGEIVTSDTIFNYSINETEITFSNSAYSVNVPYIFDGIFRLTVDDNYFQRIDLGEIKS